jgi:peptidyl-prolyl cis-trans isomerase B (cyclophilin B)
MRIFAIALAVLVAGMFSAFEMDAKSNKGGLMAIIKTNKGDIKLELYGDKAPLTVSNFVNLAQRGYYDGIKFHRVIANFMIQAGDPTGTGSGGPGYTFENEIHPTLKHSGPGILSMANTGQPKSNGSQFFITHKNTDWLDGKHTVFGQVLEGQDVVNSIGQGDVIETVVIEGDITKEMKAVAPRVAEWNKALNQKYPKLKPAQDWK